MLHRWLAGQRSPKETSESRLGAALSGLGCWERIPRQGKARAWLGSDLPQAAAAAHARCHAEMLHSLSPQTGKDCKKKKGGGGRFPFFLYHMQQYLIDKTAVFGWQH